ncbi:MAG: FG-GAP-like repeat-containing protein [bacterium]|nr:FG-GAP-like repeat-containing protein [bacterium]
MINKLINGSKESYRFNRFLLYVICLICGFAIATGALADELEQLKKLRGLGVKSAKLVTYKFDKLFKEQPELKRYISRPSKRNLLHRVRKGVYPDTIYVLGIRVEFQEDTTSLTTGNGKFDLDVNPFPYDSLGYPTSAALHDSNPPFVFPNTDSFGHNLYYDPPHTKRYFEHLLEALRNYWWDDSDQKLWIEFKVVPEGESASYKLPYPMTYYGDPVNYVQGLLTLFRDAIITCDRESPEIDFSKYAGDNGAIILFHAGSMWQTDYFGDSPYDIIACFVTNIDEYFGTPIWVDNGTVAVLEGTIYPETAFQDGMPGYLQGGLAHEFGHQVGLPDLYDTQLRTIGCGGWCLMGTGNWNLNGLLPPHTSAWCAQKLGRVKLDSLDNDTVNVEIYRRGGEDTARTKIYKIPINTREHFLVEERFAFANPDTHKYIVIGDSLHPNDSTFHYDSSATRVWKDGVLVKFDDYDWGTPCDSMAGGLAIWHIDNDKIARDSLMNEINAGSPKGVDMEEADGIQDFDTPWWLASDFVALFYGTPWDVFYNGNLDRFTPNTSPNTNDNLGSVSNVFIESISKPDTIMSFSLRFGLKYANFPIKCGDYFDINSPNVVEIGGRSFIVSSVMDTTYGGFIFMCTDSGIIKWRYHPVDAGYGANIYSSPAVGDIDGDGIPDIVCGVYFGKDTIVTKAQMSKSNLTCRQTGYQTKMRFISREDTVYKFWGKVYALDINGNLLSGFPVSVDGPIISSPLLADVNNDGKKEIIIGAHDMNLYAWDGNGDTLDGFPINLYQCIWTTPVYDSISNVIYAVPWDGRLWAIKPNGDTLWTAIEPHLSWIPATSSPIVGDINGDEKREIIVANGMGELYCVSDSGKVIWKQTLEDTSFYSSPCLADIDGDSLLDIILAAGNKIYAFNNTGANLPGFPIDTKTNEIIQSSPVVGDINNDSKLEIIIGAPAGKLLGYTNRGKLLSGFPLSVGNKIYSTPLLVDLNKDGIIEIVIGCDDGNLYAWSIDSYGALPWPMLYRDECHNGIYLIPPKAPTIPVDVFMRSPFYVYPNPVIDEGWVRYFSGNAKSVNIKIINAAGEVVKDFGGKIGEKVATEVMLPNLVSGVYICRVEVDTGNKNLVRFKKFAVVK